MRDLAKSFIVDVVSGVNAGNDSAYKACKYCEHEANGVECCKNGSGFKLKDAITTVLVEDYKNR